MAVRKQPSRSSKTTDDRHHVGALLEELRSQQQAILEGMAAMHADLSRTFNDAFSRVEARLDALEGAVRQNSEDIKRLEADVAELRTDVGDLRTEVADLRTEIAQLRSSFNSREELARIALLEARVAKLERKLKVG